MKEKKQGSDKRRSQSPKRAPEPTAKTPTLDLEETQSHMPGTRLELMQPDDLWALQRIVGNRVVSDLVHRSVSGHLISLPFIQRVDEEEESGGDGQSAGDAERAREMFREGQDMIRQDRLDQAILRFERARQADPSLRNTYWNIAECNLALGRNATAIIYYEQYMTMPGADTEAAQARLREARRLAGVSEETPVTPQPAEEAEGEVPETGTRAMTGEEAGSVPGSEERARELFQQGLELIQQGHYRQAIIRLERARQANPGLRNTYWNIAECNLEIGRIATAIIYYEQYMTMSGADIEAAQARLREVRLLSGVPEETPTTPQPAEDPEGEVPHTETSEAPSEETAPTS